MGREEQENPGNPCSDKPDSEENIRKRVEKERIGGLTEEWVLGTIFGVPVERSVEDAQKNLLMESHMRHRVSSSSMPPTHGLCMHLQIKTEERV